MAAQAPKSALNDLLLPAMRPFFAEGADISAEALAFSLALSETLQVPNGPGGGEGGASANLTRSARVCLRPTVLECAEALKRASAAFPRLHSVWGRVFNLPSVSVAAAAAAAAANDDGGGSGGSAAAVVSVSDDDVRRHEQVWTQVVERNILTSTHERQFMAFELFKAVLGSPGYAQRDTADRLFLLSPNLIRCLHNNIRGVDTYLHKPANQVATAPRLLGHTQSHTHARAPRRLCCCCCCCWCCCCCCCCCRCCRCCC